jgi:aminoglycoside phosphotransferase family enzyme/predicted kinase
MRVELVETHISWVLLTGLRAYKIKKPINPGFADFSTLERRRHFCEEELRLNRRLAADLYLDVVPITGTADNPQINGTGPAIEYAVRMLQFDHSRLLSRLEESELKTVHIDNLANLCAEFHREARVAESRSVFGTPDQVMQPVRDNFVELRRADVGMTELLSLLEQKSESLFAKLNGVFETRRRDGMIRECHGDLHLGNMFLQGDQVAVFDGIEFNDEFRWIDIISDIAFAVMDLEDRGYTAFAHRFLNRWLEMTGDYTGMAVLSFYCAYRAVVRAKVDAIRMGQSDKGSDDWQHLANDCDGYLKLAAGYLADRSPALMITTGLSGSGKTTVTQGLLESGGMIRIRSDVERKRLHGLAAEEQSDRELKSQMYSSSATEETYDRLAELVQQIIASGYSVIVDATFLRQAERERFAVLAGDLNVPFLILNCHASHEVLRERIRKRLRSGTDASEADLAVLELQIRHAEPLSEAELSVAVDADEADLPGAIELRLGQLRSVRQ